MDKFKREGNVALKLSRKQGFKIKLCSCKPKRKGVKTAWKVVKCSKQFALIAVKNAKFPSNPTAQDQYTAESAMLREDPQGQTLAAEDPIEDTRKSVY